MGSAAPLAGKDSFVDLELQRRRLEDSIQQLRKSLQHWQLWEAEYEGLKEEIASLNEDQSFITVDQLVRQTGQCHLFLVFAELEVIGKSGQGIRWEPIEPKR